MLAVMVRWSEFVEAEPELAAAVQRLFDAHRHKTIATLRADGGPRISGIEAQFGNGELTFGSMPGARKGADLARDPRFALHSASVDPPEDDPSGWPGDAKISGRAVLHRELTGEMPGQEYRAEISEVVRTRVRGDRLVIELWRPGAGLRTTTRR